MQSDEVHDSAVDTESEGYGRGAAAGETRVNHCGGDTIDYVRLAESCDADIGAVDAVPDDLLVGRTVTARVAGVCEKGLVVKVRGARGFIHRADLGDHPDRQRPKDFHLGDRVHAAINHIDREADIIGLSVRDDPPAPLQESEWLDDAAADLADSGSTFDSPEVDPPALVPHDFTQDEEVKFERLCEAKYPIGGTVSGVVTEVGRHGASVDLGEVQGLVPVRLLEWGLVEDAAAVVAVGDTVRANVVEYDWDWRRLLLSVKHAHPRPWEEFVAAHPEGSIITGRVFRLKDDGVMVDFDGLVEFLPTWELAWYPVLHPHEVISVGDEIDVRVMAVDREQHRVRISLRQVDPDVWTRAARRNPVGAVATGTVVSVSDDFALLNVDGVRGNIHVGELSWAAVPSAHDVVAVGDRVRAKVLRVCPEERKLELSLKQLDFAPWDEFTRRHAVGSVVSGTVQSISAMHATVDIDGVRGMIPIGEVAWSPVHDIRDRLAVGDRVDAEVVEFNDAKKFVDLSLRRMDLTVWDRYVAEHTVGDVVHATVTYFTKFGAVLDIGGMKGLLSVNDMDWAPASDPTRYVELDQELDVQILDIDRELHRIYVGLRQLHPGPWQRFMAKHPAGSVVSGTVAAIQKSNVIMNVDGVKGIIPLSQLSWRPVADPATVVAVGDTLRVLVVSFSQHHHRVILSRKQVDSRSWGKVAAKYVPGAEVDGTVHYITNGEVVVDLGDVEGRVPIGELAWRRVKHPSEVVAMGEQLRAQVLRVNRDRCCIDLSLRNSHHEDWERFVARHPVGSKAEGQVTDLTKFGAFVDVDGMEALLHNKNISWRRHPKGVPPLRVGERVRVQVLTIEPESHHVTVGLKQCGPDPWLGVGERYQPGQRVSGEVVNVMNYGVFVELEPGVVGLLHASKVPGGLRDAGERQSKSMLVLGRDIEVGIAEVDVERRRISLTQEFAAHGQPPAELETAS